MRLNFSLIYYKIQIWTRIRIIHFRFLLIFHLNRKNLCGIWKVCFWFSDLFDLSFWIKTKHWYKNQKSTSSVAMSSAKETKISFQGTNICTKKKQEHRENWYTYWRKRTEKLSPVFFLGKIAHFVWKSRFEIFRAVCFPGHSWTRSSVRFWLKFFFVLFCVFKGYRVFKDCRVWFCRWYLFKLLRSFAIVQRIKNDVWSLIQTIYLSFFTEPHYKKVITNSF